MRLLGNPGWPHQFIRLVVFWIVLWGAFVVWDNLTVQLVIGVGFLAYQAGNYFGWSEGMDNYRRIWRGDR